MNAIVKGVYLGDMSEVERAKRDEMSILSVMWDQEEGRVEDVSHIATTNLSSDTNGPRTIANCVLLNDAADWMHAEVQLGRRVFLYCAFGMERSPLTMVWYLMRYHGYTLDQGYRLVKINRPLTQDRRFWLPMNWEQMVRDGLETIT